MAKPTSRYVCQSCGAVYPKWTGRCDACGEWNTLVEEAVEARPGAPRTAGRGRVQFVGLQGTAATPARAEVGIAELDRVLGGGFVPASVVLVGGDPGIGKSTLMLQAAATLARSGRGVRYISGEESIDQVRMRAGRLGLADAPMQLAAAINVRDIAASLEAEPDLGLVVIDSIQTMWLDTIESAPGTVGQVRAASFELIRLAKSRGFALVLVGHVTKEGALAGPRVLEHMVDAVLYFEGDRGHQFRILRAVKNRFGATDEIGVFEMTGAGLSEVANPSALFLAERRGNIAGSAVFAGLEGTRPVLLEVQALLSPNSGGSPRRSVVGWDSGRLAMLLAVLDARAGLRVGASDVYLNVAGGLRGDGARGRPGGGGGPRVGGHRDAYQPRGRVLRRGGPVRRGAPGGPGRRAAEGGAEAGVRGGVPAPPPGPRRQAAAPAGRAAAGRDRPCGGPGRGLHGQEGGDGLTAVAAWFTRGTPRPICRAPPRTGTPN